MKEQRRRKKEKKIEIRKNEEVLRKVTVKIGLERIFTQKGGMMEMLLDRNLY